MPFFLVSPQVQSRTIDLTTIIPQASTAIGAMAGDFRWGPVNEITSISNKRDLVDTFGEPDDYNFEDFFSAYSYLNYSSSLRLLRIKQANAQNAIAYDGAPSSPSPSPFVIENNNDFEKTYNVTGSSTSIPSDIFFAAKYPGRIGNSLMVTYCLADKESFDNWIAPSSVPTAPPPTYTNRSVGPINYSQYFSKEPGTSQYVSGRTASPYPTQVTGDEIHLLVIDYQGWFTGTPGTILERYENASLCPDAKSPDGTSIFIGDMLLYTSKYIYMLSPDPLLANSHAGETIDDVVTAGHDSYFNRARAESATLIDGIPSPIPAPGTYGPFTFAKTEYKLVEGQDWDATDPAPVYQSPVADKIGAYNPFLNTTEIDVTLLIAGRIPENFSDSISYCNSLIAKAEERRDSIALVSPPAHGVSGSTTYTDTKNAIDFADQLSSSSYGVLDSCAVKIFDEYKGVYRWIPANGIVAGLCANTDIVAEPWYSPAGYSRGQLKNIVKISYNPDQFERDDLYQARINPIVQFPGEGTILFGDKTLLARPSAFDRINVRRLFNVLEKSIASFAKYMLFEFNDEFTRARFINVVTPFLRDVKGRRGIYDFKVVCDETNNTPIIIDSNEFTADIYIQPARSINFIRLNFIATRTGANFEEIITGTGA